MTEVIRSKPSPNVTRKPLQALQSVTPHLHTHGNRGHQISSRPNGLCRLRPECNAAKMIVLPFNARNTKATKDLPSASPGFPPFPGGAYPYFGCREVAKPRPSSDRTPLGNRHHGTLQHDGRSSCPTAEITKTPGVSTGRPAISQDSGYSHSRRLAASAADR